MLTRGRRRALIALVPLAAVPLLVAATHGSKRLTALSCGQVITANTTLDADVGPCGLGVVIGADHVTLNLNGHRLLGNGSGLGVSSAHSGVVVENGSVNQFNTGVTLSGDSSRVMNLRVGGNAGTGINVSGKNDVVSGNRVFGNGLDGIHGSGAGSQYTNNTLQTNDGDGLFANNPALIGGNKSLSNTHSGIFFNNPAGGSVTATNNIANGNQHGLVEDIGDATVVTVTGNQAFFNSTLGIVGFPGVSDGGHNKASGNGTLAQCVNIVCS
jgi:hypothetical protein